MSNENHTIEFINGVTIVRCLGPGLPLTMVGKIMSKAKKDEVLDPALGGRIGALLVFGSKQALAEYRATQPEVCQAIENEITSARQAYTGLELEEIVNYLTGYDRGSSANALLMTTAGLTLEGSMNAVPHDKSDLGRCIRLCQSCSVVKNNLSRAQALFLLSTWDKTLSDWFHEIVNGGSPDSNPLSPQP